MALHFVQCHHCRRPSIPSSVGTRLTNITLDLRHRDVDVALDTVAAHVNDWQLARIGHCPPASTSRGRADAGPGAVSSDTDGCREGVRGAGRRDHTLQRSARRLIWLIPSRDEALSAASRAKSDDRHVDDFRPSHNLDSMRIWPSAEERRDTPPSRQPAEEGTDRDKKSVGPRVLKRRQGCCDRHGDSDLGLLTRPTGSQLVSTEGSCWVSVSGAASKARVQEAQSHRRAPRTSDCGSPTAAWK